MGVGSCPERKRKKEKRKREREINIIFIKNLLVKLKVQIRLTSNFLWYSKWDATLSLILFFGLLIVITGCTWFLHYTRGWLGYYLIFFFVLFLEEGVTQTQTQDNTHIDNHGIAEECNQTLNTV